MMGYILKEAQIGQIIESLELCKTWEKPCAQYVWNTQSIVDNWDCVRG